MWRVAMTDESTRVVLPPNDDDPSESWLKLVAALCADVLFFVGCVMLISFHARELVLFCRRDTVADVLYSAGFACLFISTTIELSLDVLGTRTVAHGRYSTKRLWNIFISVLFLIGTITDIVVFILWRQQEQNDNAQIPEYRASWSTAVIWLTMALLVLVTTYFSKAVSTSSSWLEEGLDIVGNLLLFAGSVLVVAAIAVSDPDSNFDKGESQLELAAFATWIGAVSFYLAADIIRLRTFKQECRGSEDGADNDSAEV